MRDETRQAIESVIQLALAFRDQDPDYYLGTGSNACAAWEALDEAISELDEAMEPYRKGGKDGTP